VTTDSFNQVESIQSPGRRDVAEMLSEDAEDPLIAAFKKDVDRTLLIENLRRTLDERARRMNEFLRALDTLRAVGTRRRLEAAGQIPPGG
jgi:hypothetical protein